MNYQFPKGFWWGTASSATQSESAACEDGKGESIWDYWYKQEPERFFGNIGPDNTDDFYHRYNEDIELMSAAGFNSYRTSISWARLIPNGTGEVNQKAVTFYREVLNGMLNKGITPVLNLFHFDMPMALQNKGGWESCETVDAFVRYAVLCFELFGDLVKTWVTFNEPIVPVEGGYLYGFHYPAVCDMKRAVLVGYHTALASARVIAKGKEMNIGLRLGIVLNLTPSYPKSNSDADVNAAKAADLLFNKSFLDPSVKGSWPEGLVKILSDNGWMPKRVENDLEIIYNGRVDFLGVNYYQPRRIKAKDIPCKEPKLPEDLFDYYHWENAEMNKSRGWEIYPKGIYDISVMLKQEYGNLPWFISENGIGIMNEEAFADKDGVVMDDYRISFVSRHLYWLAKALDEGCNCFGYHMWTFIDNWSWCNAFKNRYGLVRLDKENGNKRVPKKSFKWFKQLASSNSCEIYEK